MIDLQLEHFLGAGALGLAVAIMIIGATCYFWFPKKNDTTSDELDSDSEEMGFPTAQMISAWRALDAVTDSQIIGTNTGRSDLAAKLFPEKVSEYVRKSSLTDSGEEDVAECMQKATHGPRAKYFDRQWMSAIRDGVRQFVIVACGLDARAWRLPHPSTCTIYEVDVPRCLKFKKKNIPDLETYELECDRVEVAGDLRDLSWIDKLIEKGFDPEQRSFFILEGILMYLPADAPAKIFEAISEIMAKGSYLAADVFSGPIEIWRSTIYHNVVKQFGTEWTHSVKDAWELQSMLRGFGLGNIQIKNIHQKEPSNEDEGDMNVHEPVTSGSVDDEEARKYSARILDATRRMSIWPAPTIPYVRKNYVLVGEEGITKMLEEMVEDKSNYHGLREESVEMKARVVELCLANEFIELVKEEAAKLDKFENMSLSELTYYMFCCTKN